MSNPQLLLCYLCKCWCSTVDGNPIFPPRSLLVVPGHIFLVLVTTQGAASSSPPYPWTGIRCPERYWVHTAFSISKAPRVFHQRLIGSASFSGAESESDCTRDRTMQSNRDVIDSHRWHLKGFHSWQPIILPWGQLMQNPGKLCSASVVLTAK